MRASWAYFANPVHHRVCSTCQSPVHVRPVTRHTPGAVPVPVPSPLFPQRSYLFIECPQCGTSLTDLGHVLLEDPAARAFVLERPHVLCEPDTLVSYAGQEALCSRLVDLNTDEQVTILAHPETLEIMATLLP